MGPNAWHAFLTGLGVGVASLVVEQSARRFAAWRQRRADARREARTLARLEREQRAHFPGRAIVDVEMSEEKR